MSMVRMLLGNLQPSVNMPKNVNQKQKDQHEKSAAKEPTNSKKWQKSAKKNRKLQNRKTSGTEAD